MPKMTATLQKAPRLAGASVLIACAIAAAVVLGVVLRLADPLSSSVVPAEDPYTHMALVREHLHSGELEGLYAGQSLYPPGLHGFLAATWVYSGLELYDIILFGPVVFGAIGILGLGLLLWRHAGPVAGCVGALAMAVAPEAIFRTTMMSPTALDLALLPFFFHALLRVLAGRLAWIAVAGPMAIFLALAHPWLLVILAVAGIAVLALTFLTPAPAGQPRPLGIVACIAVLGMGVAIALRMPGFDSALGVVDPSLLGGIGLAVGAVTLAPLALLLALRWRGSVLAWRGFRATAWTRALTSLVFALALGATYGIAVQRGLPEFVDLRQMFGWPILVLAAAAWIALPYIATPIARLFAGLFVATLPFTIFNPLDSEFLPHRTAIFLGIAMVGLAGVAAAALVRALAQGLPQLAIKSTATSQRRRRVASTLSAVPLVLATVLAGSVYAGTPDAYPDGWYRLYTPCELDALREVARQADAAPDAVVVTGDWQSKLVLAGLTNDADRIWYHDAMFLVPARRDALIANMEKEDRPIVVVLDRYLRVETPDADTTFTASPPWRETGSYCANTGVGYPRVVTYTTGAQA